MYFNCGKGTKEDPFDPVKHVAQREPAERKYWEKYPVYCPLVGNPPDPQIRALAQANKQRYRH